MKIILVGPDKAGKTAITKAISLGVAVVKTETPLENYESTIAVDFATKGSFQFWDTAGHERYRSLTSSYYRAAEMVILVCDLSNESSIESQLSFFMQSTRDAVLVDANYILVGNKTDLLGKGNSREQELQDFAARYGIPTVVTTTCTDLISIKKLERIMLEKSKSQLSLPSTPAAGQNDVYQAFKARHEQIFNQERRGILGFFRRTHMDFTRHQDIASIRQYAHDHPKSRTARLLQEVEDEMKRAYSTSTNSGLGLRR